MAIEVSHTVDDNTSGQVRGGCGVVLGGLVGWQSVGRCGVDVVWCGAV